jgi:invasion protein IalB
MLNLLLQKQTLVAIFAAVIATALAPAAEMGPPPAPPPAAEDPVDPRPEEEAGQVPSEEPQAEPVARVFQDWRVGCADGACAAYTRLDAADGTEVLRVELRGTPAVLGFVTPLGLHLPAELVATIGEGAEARVARTIPWRTCPVASCIADTPVDGELLAALRRERAGTATFTLVEGVPVRLGFSLMGFSAARDALAALSPGP